MNILEAENILLKTLPGNIKNIEEKIEDRTNRQLRETLVIKNVPENPDESYKDTKKLLAELISENVDGVTYEYAFSQIKRAHMETFRSDSVGNTRTGKRIIFAALHSWDLCEEMKNSFRLKCIANADFNISVDQKYGPLTSQRRRKALEMRRELKQNGLITSEYIDFPAKLMVNRPGKIVNGKKVYRLHQIFRPCLYNLTFFT